MKTYPRVFDNDIEQLLNEVDLCHVLPFENEIYDEYSGCTYMVEDWLKVSPVYAAKKFFKYILGNSYPMYHGVKKYEFIQLREGLKKLCD